MQAPEMTAREAEGEDLNTVLILALAVLAVLCATAAAAAKVRWNESRKRGTMSEQQSTSLVTALLPGEAAEDRRTSTHAMDERKEPLFRTRAE